VGLFGQGERQSLIVFGLFSKKREVESFKPKECIVEFVLVMVDGGTPEKISERLGIVCDVAHGKGALVEAMFGPCALIVAVEGMVPFLSGWGQHLAIVEELKRQLGIAGKTVHGVSHGLVGIFGSNHRFSYGVAFPKFDRMLGTIAKMPFGQALEFQGDEFLGKE
jgi:hypothetical protein